MKRAKTIALLAGALSACGFAPLNLWPLTLGGLAILIALVAQAPSAKSAFARGWWWGLGHFTIGLNWIAHAFTFQDFMPAQGGYVAVLLVSLYCALYPGLASWLVRRIASPRQGPTFAFAFAAAWIASEYLRATLFTGFAWNPIAVMWVTTHIAMLTTVIGTYGLSGLTVLGIALLVPGVQDAGRRHLAIGFGVAAVAAALVMWPYTTPGIDNGPAIRIVQPNVSQAQRHDREFDEESVRILERLTGPPSAEPRLILWPEAGVPYYLEEESWARYRLAKLLGPRDMLLTGGTTLIYDRRGDLTGARNSVFAMDANADLVARYDKAHLVPYGEYLPMRPILGAIGLSQLVQSDVDFIPGPAPRTIDIKGFGKIAMQICYEIIFSGQVVDRAHRPGFIFNPSTDAWFGAWGPPQHLAQARMRAIEEGLPVIRATPTGISAVIDADGRLLAALPLNKAGVITTRLPPAKAPTVFAQFGNVIPLMLAVLLALLAVAPRLRARYGAAT
ncbi:MAG: apolipoprotein N-acyltransferase [Sphingomonadales bacterium]